MTPAMAALAAFCTEDPENRFLQVQYLPAGPGCGPQWEVAICLGSGWTCRTPRLVGTTRWLEVRGPVLDKVLEQAVARTGTARPLKVAVAP